MKMEISNELDTYVNQAHFCERKADVSLHKEDLASAIEHLKEAYNLFEETLKQNSNRDEEMTLVLNSQLSDLRRRIDLYTGMVSFQRRSSERKSRVVRQQAQLNDVVQPYDGLDSSSSSKFNQMDSLKCATDRRLNGSHIFQSKQKLSNMKGKKLPLQEKDRIEALTSKINILKKEIDSVAGELDSETKELERVEQEFQNYDDKCNRLRDELQTMNISL